MADSDVDCDVSVVAVIGPLDTPIVGRNGIMKTIKMITEVIIIVFCSLNEKLKQQETEVILETFTSFCA